MANRLHNFSSYILVILKIWRYKQIQEKKEEQVTGIKSISYEWLQTGKHWKQSTKYKVI